MVGTKAYPQATILPPGEQCFQALTPTSGGPNGTGTGFVGLLGTITGGSGGTAGLYGGVPLTGGHGTNATANILVTTGVTSLSTLNPGQGYVAGDVLSAASGNIGGVTGFSVPISSVAINQSLAGGSVYYYVPNTSTFKQTWQNSGETVLNTNPVQLDANGCAIVYGSGIYRQVLEDSLGNIVWDQLTASTGNSSNFYWANLAGGTPNVVTVTDASFSGTDGQIISFIPLFTNTGPVTLNVSGFGAIPVVKDTSTGAVALTGGELVANSPSNIVEVEYSATQGNFHILNLVQSAASATPTQPPQGYLNLLGVAAGGPIQGSTDVTAATTLYYTPYVGNQIPVWNGSSFTILAFPELQIVLSASAQSASTIYDVCVSNQNGTPVGVIGPAWSNSSGGTSARGTGNGSAQLTYENGILVNAVQIISNNGATTYTVPALECTYVGSIFIDGTGGQVSNYRTYGQSRKWGVWNAYWRVPVCLLAGDSTATWNYGTNTFRPSNNNTANSLTVFSGLQQETYNLDFQQSYVGGTSGFTTLGIGWNSTTVPSGALGVLPTVTNTISATTRAILMEPPSLGINVATSLEASDATTAFSGRNPQMQLQACWRG